MLTGMQQTRTENLVGKTLFFALHLVRLFSSPDKLPSQGWPGVRREIIAENQLILQRVKNLSYSDVRCLDFKHTSKDSA